jgi:hypothetical protein
MALGGRSFQKKLGRAELDLWLTAPYVYGKCTQSETTAKQNRVKQSAETMNPVGFVSCTEA